MEFLKLKFHKGILDFEDVNLKDEEQINQIIYYIFIFKSYNGRKI